MRSLIRQEPALLEDEVGHQLSGPARPRLVNKHRWLARAADNRRWVALAVMLLLLGGAGGFTFVQARGLQDEVIARFRSAQGHMERGKSELKQASQNHDARLIDQARTNFRAAIDDFRLVRQTADGSPLASAGARLPLASGYVGPRLQAVNELADVGTLLARAALRGADVDQLLVAPPAGMPENGTARLLAVMHQATPLVATVRQYLQQAAQSAGRLDPAVLPVSQKATFDSIRQTISKGLAGLDEFNRLIPVLDEVMGANGPRTYLVEQTNPFELRAGGGYIGTYSLVNADHGTLRVVKSGDTHELPDFSTHQGQAGYVKPPDAMLEFIQNRSWGLGDSNFFPDFESNARAAMEFSQRDFGQKVDGVISLDLFAVAAMLQLTGPIQLEGTRTTLDAGNLAQIMIMLDLQDPLHKQKVGSLAGALMQHVTALGAERWPQLLDILNQQVSQRHIQVYFNDKGAQAELQRLGWSGGLAWDGNQDFVYPLESNFGGNKANYFLTRQYTIDLTRTAGLLHHQIRLDLTLDLSKAPAAAVKTITGYRAYFRLFLPAGASNARITSVKASDQPYVQVPPGTKVVEGWQLLRLNAAHKGTIEITFEYDTPWTADAGGDHVLYWQKQPGTWADKFTLHWNDGSTTATATGDLRWDRVFVLGRGKIQVQIGKTAQAQIPKLSL